MGLCGFCRKNHGGALEDFLYQVPKGISDSLRIILVLQGIEQVVEWFPRYIERIAGGASWPPSLRSLPAVAVEERKSPARLSTASITAREKARIV